MRASLLVGVVLVAGVAGIGGGCKRCEGCRRVSAREPAAPREVAPPPRSRPPTMRTTTPALAVSWAMAEAVAQPETWDATAAVYERELASCVADCADAAYAVVLARRNALAADPIAPPAEPGLEPLPPRVRALVQATDVYAGLAPDSDPERAAMGLLAANAQYRWHQPDAVERLEALLRDHRDDPVAEYAANMLLDLLTKAERIADLRDWVDELLADTAFLTGKDQLRATLERLRELLASP
jgi:hypothetical protein